MAHENSTREELLEEIAFWTGMYGEALDALDECAAYDEEDWDRQEYAETKAATLRAKHKAGPATPSRALALPASAIEGGTEP